MLSKGVKAALLDLAQNIDLAEAFTDGFQYEGFAADTRTFYAVTRCLEIISEASRKLPPEMKARHGNIPWPQIAGAGNVYRHEYGGVANRLVWHTVKDELPALRLAIAAEMSCLES
jgi:uncharacterized protein with HEPN domain